MGKLSALLIDDDEDYCQNFKLVTSQNFDLKFAHNGEDGMRLLKSYSPDIVFLDYKFKTPETGLDILTEIRRLDQNIPVIMISENASIDLAVRSMKLGAYHFYSKYGHVSELMVVAEQELARLRQRILVNQNLAEKYDPILGCSDAIAGAKSQAARSARFDSNILITGESGVGKELIAWEIHRLSNRKDKPWVVVNCSAIPENLFESEFFGHERGSYTGATGKHLGYFELADGGTLFLDEVGTLNPCVQAKLLRCIELKQFRRVGGESELEADFRTIAATNIDLDQALETKTFRRDLYHRLNVFHIHLEPLHQRPEDIPIIAEYYLNKYRGQIGLEPRKLTSDEAIILKQHHWPGNIRELRNVIERFVIMNEELGLITSKADLIGDDGGDAAFGEALLKMKYKMAKEKVLEKFRDFYFSETIRRFGGNISRAANWMEIPRSTVYRSLKAKEMKTDQE